jgi:hypothetical protein
MKLKQFSWFKTILVSAFFTLFNSGISNAFLFKVLGVSGNVKLQIDGQVRNLRPGTKLEAGQVLIIESGYCGLMHANGKILEIKTPGSFPATNLAKSITGNSKTKVSDKYLEYVLGQLSKAEEKDMETNVRKYMDVPGSVQRGSSKPNTGNAASIYVDLFSSNQIMSAPYYISWTPITGSKGYEVNLIDRFDEIIMQQKSDSAFTEIDFSKLLIKEKESYKLVVTSPSTGSKSVKEYIMNVVAPTDLGLQTDESAAANMVNGMICEEKHYFLDAIKYYEKASRQEPGVESYSEALSKLKSKLVKK